jgi:hypothetical protein
MKVLPGIMKDSSKVPEIVLSSKEEKENIDSRGEELAKEFGCAIVVEEADRSEEPKAKNAWPGKPALVVK